MGFDLLVLPLIFKRSSQTAPLAAHAVDVAAVCAVDVAAACLVLYLLCCRLGAVSDRMCCWPSLLLSAVVMVVIVRLVLEAIFTDPLFRPSHVDASPPRPRVPALGALRWQGRKARRINRRLQHPLRTRHCKRISDGMASSSRRQVREQPWHAQWIDPLKFA